MTFRRWLAGSLALVIVSGAAGASKKKKKQDEEPITQTLPLLQDPPATVTAEVERLGFRVAPLSPKGLLSQQVRDGLKALMRDARGASIVKIRAFVAGTGDMRRVQTILSETFGEKRLPIPALSTIQGGALPGEGVQVALESIEVNKRAVNPNGLAFLSGQPAPSIEKSMEQLNVALRGLSIGNDKMLQVTCFLSALEDHANFRKAVAEAFPAAAMNFVQMQRLPVQTAVECEGVAALSSPPGERVKVANPAGLPSSPNYSQTALVGPGRVVISGTQMGFGTREADIRLAFDRLGKSLEAAQVGYKDVVFTRVYPVSEAATERFRSVRFNYLDKARPPASTLLPFEGLPSLDASFALEVIAVPR